MSTGEVPCGLQAGLSREGGAALWSVPWAARGCALARSEHGRSSNRRTFHPQRALSPAPTSQAPPPSLGPELLVLMCLLFAGSPSGHPTALPGPQPLPCAAQPRKL